MGFAALGAETGRRTSGCLGDLAGAEAPGADADPFCRAVDERPHGLEVRLEPPGSHVVGMRDRPADDRSLVADFAPLGHEFLLNSADSAQIRPLASSAN